MEDFWEFEGLSLQQVRANYELITLTCLNTRENVRTIEALTFSVGINLCI